MNRIFRQAADHPDSFHKLLKVIVARIE